MAQSHTARSNWDRDEVKRDQYVGQQMNKHSRFYKNVYDVLYTINDFLMGLWFLIGSCFFYFESLKNWGVTLFVLASIQFIIRPTIRLVHDFRARNHYKEEYKSQQNLTNKEDKSR
ncbi:YrhK family protein [Halobacillus sp. Marseille-P3879]|uniref:YrhK family protein n=1 Tax=Halobacillus sp. Marseille-P3879 TaxID=2045014 RepID=UPI000C7C1262|nr:YrhK family protein [Halobacillus sp. Marseille-P3879]